MARRTITWAENASNELRTILEFYEERNQSTTYSKWLLGEINYRVELIAGFPKIGRVTANKNFRIVPFHHFGIIYRFSDRHVQITSIWDFRRDPEKRIDRT